jgi:hypothetical protein
VAAPVTAFVRVTVHWLAALLVRLVGVQRSVFNCADAVTVNVKFCDAPPADAVTTAVVLDVTDAADAVNDPVL